MPVCCNDWQVDVTVISSLNLKLMIIYCKEALTTDSTSPCSFSEKKDYEVIICKLLSLLKSCSKLQNRNSGGLLNVCFAQEKFYKRNQSDDFNTTLVITSLSQWSQGFSIKCMFSCKYWIYLYPRLTQTFGCFILNKEILL